MESKSLSLAKKYLGREVEVVVNRPLGFTFGKDHPRHGFLYEVNYGYVPGVIAPDGEELDAYCLGWDKPLERARGVCIALIHRLDDDDDKLVVVPFDKRKMTREEIEESTYFQEQWFNSKVIMENEREFDWTSFWEKTSPLWVKIFSWLEHWVVLRLLKDREVKSFLELGGGAGYLAKLVSQKLGYQLTLVDNNQEGYRLYKKVSNFGDYVLKDFFKYKPDRNFDLVLSFGVVEHYRDKEKRVEAIKVHKRLSKKYVAVFVPRASFWTRRVLHASKEAGFEKIYTKKELEQEVEQAGLRPVSWIRNFHVLGCLAE